MLYTTRDVLSAIRASLRGKQGQNAVHAAWLRMWAEEAMTAPHQLVTEHPSPAASGDPHDYFSEGPYWWPDPANPNGPYLRRDGEVNPDRFSHHHTALTSVCCEVYRLALGAYHLGESTWADRAEERLQAFFVEKATRMNPNMNHAQAVRNLTPGRCYGLIEACKLHRLLFALELLTEIGRDSASLRGTRAWLIDFEAWLRESELGREEGNTRNNHAMWYTSLTMALARYNSHEAAFEHDCDRFRFHLTRQMAEDGRFPEETARTNAFSYSAENLTAAANAAIEARRTSDPYRDWHPELGPHLFYLG